MKPLVPLADYNIISGVPVRVKAGRPVGTCCGCFSQDTRRTKLGTYYCEPCYESALRFLGRIEREGDAAVRAAVVP